MNTVELAVPENIAQAIESFTKQLPNPKTNTASTIEEQVLVKGRKITLRAQKAKSFTGMKWNVVVC